MSKALSWEKLLDRAFYKWGKNEVNEVNKVNELKEELEKGTGTQIKQKVANSKEKYKKCFHNFFHNNVKTEWFK